jgi:hypothetical protein
VLRISDFRFGCGCAGDPLDSLMSRSADDCLCLGGWPGLLEAGSRSDKSPLHRLSTGQRAETPAKRTLTSQTSWGSLSTVWLPMSLTLVASRPSHELAGPPVILE